MSERSGHCEKSIESDRKYFLTVMGLSFLILLLSLAPRYLLATAWLPDYFIDENDIVEHSIAYLSGNLEPGMYGYGPLYSYLLASVYWISQAMQGEGYVEYAVDIFFDRQDYYFIARLFNAVIHLVTAVVSYHVAKRVFGMRVALLSLPLLLFPLPDLLTFYTPRVDSLLALAAMGAILFMLAAVENPRIKYYVYSGAFFAFGLATKPLPGLLLLPTLALSLILPQIGVGMPTSLKGCLFCKSVFHAMWQTIISYKTWAVAAGAVGAYILTNPYSVVNAKRFYWEQVSIVSTEGSRMFQPGWDVSRFFNTLGVPFVFVAIVGTIYVLGHAMLKRDVKSAILASYPIVYFAAFSMGAAREYWYVPVLFLSAIFAAKLIVDITNAMFPSVRQSARVFVLISPILVILVQPTRVLYHDALAAKRGVEANPALSARILIESAVPHGAKVIAYGMAGYLPRIVDYRKDAQEIFGEYFMRVDRANSSYMDLYGAAHRSYTSSGRPAYEITYIDSNCSNDSGFKESLVAIDPDIVVTHCFVDELVRNRGRAIADFESGIRLFSKRIFIYDMRAQNGRWTEDKDRK